MSDFLETTVDKFTLRVPRNLLFREDGMWLRIEGEEAVVGVSDFLQLQSGDVSFVDLPEVGARLVADQVLGSMETMKVTLDLISPASGAVLECNKILDKAPEKINEDPYGEGWLLRMRLSDPSGVAGSLLGAEAYFSIAEQSARDQV